ncbi:MAG: hypothetical protein V7K32_09785 [Nostoc sp.]
MFKLNCDRSLQLLLGLTHTLRLALLASWETRRRRLVNPEGGSIN